MKKEHISDALGLLHDDILEETDHVRNGKTQKKYFWGKWVSVVACICLVVAIVTAVSNIINPNSEPSSGGGTTDGVGMLPKGIQPELLVDGTIFYWSKLSQVIPGLIETYLPEGYTEYGRISSITESEVTEDCQMKAGFDASGTIYTSEITPEAVYVLMTTDWFESRYVRFITSELNGSRIMWNGKHYRIAPWLGEGMSEVLEELPEGCELVGQLHFIGEDAVPVNDLETNCKNDSFNRSLEGREVFYDSSDPDYIYVYERYYWREGERDTYLKCSLWNN